MIICQRCTSANRDGDAYCSQCGLDLRAIEDVPTVAKNPGGGSAAECSATEGSDDAEHREDTASGIRIDPQRLQQFQRTLQSQPRRAAEPQADVLFLLDCTASMQGEIEALKEVIGDFAATIEAEGVHARVGLLAFRDRCLPVPEEPELFDFDGSPFTRDAERFRRQVGQLRAEGGGDIPESSLDALLLAVRQPVAQDAHRVLVLITDAPPHVPDREAQSVEEVAQALRKAEVRQLYLVIRTQDTASQIYLKLLAGTRGLAFELGQGNDILNRAESLKRTLLRLGRTISQQTT